MISAGADEADELLAKLIDHGVDAHLIGEVTEEHPQRIYVI